LGLLYDGGRGVGRDLVEAARWYLKSAEQRYVCAQSNLGFLCGYSEGIPRDCVQVHLWLSLAAGDRDASAYRDFMEQGMTPEQTAEARRLFNAWKAKQAGEGQRGH
jgi:uncharacterized protein